MKLLREYIRELLTESIIHPKVMRMIDKAEQMKLTLKVLPYGVKLSGPKKGEIPVASVQWDNDPLDGPCLKSKIVSATYADEGLGPLIYDIAIEATGGLVPDRITVSDAARNVWDYYNWGRSDVKKEQLDDLENKLTPEERDNCEQLSASEDSNIGSPRNWDESVLSKKYSKVGTPVMDELRKRGMIKE